jgi:hypothetical protein
MAVLQEPSRTEKALLFHHRSPFTFKTTFLFGYICSVLFEAIVVEE